MTKELIEEMFTVALQKAKIKFPQWPNDIIHAAGIVSEECGELNRACVQYVYEGRYREEIIEEALHTMVTAYRLLENIEKEETKRRYR
jgi:hypothetical protein